MTNVVRFDGTNDYVAAFPVANAQTAVLAFSFTPKAITGGWIFNVNNLLRLRLSDDYFQVRSSQGTTYRTGGGISGFAFAVDTQYSVLLKLTTTQVLLTINGTELVNSTISLGAEEWPGVDGSGLNFFTGSSPGTNLVQGDVHGFLWVKYGGVADQTYSSFFDGSDQPKAITATVGSDTADWFEDGVAADWNARTEVVGTLEDVGGGGNTLAADAGSYAVTGNAATLAAGRSISFDAGSYSLTGQAAGLAAGRVLTASLGAYSLTGNAATLTGPQNALSADLGSYSITGNAATLTASRALSLDAGAYTLTGPAATLSAGRALALDAGSYALAGNSATLTVSRSLSADVGSYTITGNAVTLSSNAAANFTADTGRTFTVAAEARSFTVGAEARAFTVAAETRRFAA